MTMSFAWDKEQLAVKEKVIQFAQRELNNDLIENDRNSRFNRDGWQKCAQLGILGWPIPAEYGGEGMDYLTTILALEGLGYGCRDNGLVFAINNHLWSCALSILDFGTEAQKQTFLPPMCRGELIGAQVLTEHDTGSDGFGMKTQAVRSGDVYILNGVKAYITNALIANVFIVFARTDSNAGVERSISAFIVTKELPGLRITREFEKTGLRTTPMGELVFEDCLVPADRLLGSEGEGYDVFQSTIEWERGYYFASQIGVMERLLETSAQYARQRQQFGRPISSFQSISHKIVDMKVRLELARLLVYKIGWLKEQGRHAFLESSIAKLFISESVVQASRDAIQIHGARGYLTEYGLERELRDSLAGTIYAGTSEIQRNIIAAFLEL